MADSLSQRLSTAQKLMIAGAALLALFIPVAIGVTTVSNLRAQPPLSGPPLSFEVVSVKDVGPVFPPGLRGSREPIRSGNLVHWVTHNSYMVRYAYHLQYWQWQGLDDPGNWCVVEARTKESTTDDELRRMFQTLLAERFEFKAHRETRESNGYWLTVAKNGPKIKPVISGDHQAPMPPWMKGLSPDRATQMEGSVLITVNGKALAVTGRRGTMAQLAEGLQGTRTGFVLDKTGLTGAYYFGFLFTPSDQLENSDAPLLSDALQGELGLKLEPHKGPVEILMIDHVRKTPTDN